MTPPQLLLPGAFATARRVLAQLRRDPATIVMILVVPCVLLALLRWALTNTPGAFDRIAPGLFGVFPLMLMFVVASIATLRERVTGTLQRLLATPMNRVELLAGYVLAFGGLALAQAAITTLLTVTVLKMPVTGSPWFLVLAAALSGLLGVSLGLLTSVFARTEFQAVQHMPTVVLPQFLLCGLIVPLEAMPTTLRWIAFAMPMTHAVDVSIHAATGTANLTDFATVSGLLLLALGFGAVTLRRRTS